jgi:hypothetical protein
MVTGRVLLIVAAVGALITAPWLLAIDDWTIALATRTEQRHPV